MGNERIPDRLERHQDRSIPFGCLPPSHIAPLPAGLDCEILGGWRQIPKYAGHLGNVKATDAKELTQTRSHRLIFAGWCFWCLGILNFWTWCDVAPCVWWFCWFSRCSPGTPTCCWTCRTSSIVGASKTTRKNCWIATPPQINCMWWSRSTGTLNSQFRWVKDYCYFN